MNIGELLSHVEKRPQMYFREKDIYFLESFLGGFFVSEYLKNKDFKDDFRSDFYEYLQKKFSLDNKSTWADFIHIISKNENLNSVDTFFREYHLFKKENK